MVSLLLMILGATAVVSLVSLVGVFTLSLKEDVLNRILHILLGLASGALLGGAFFHLLPESIGAGNVVFAYVMIGFVLFFLSEKYLFWRHCHEGKCEVHTFTYMNLIGDAIHNFIDGLVIAGSFLVDISLGFITTFIVVMHEIPQEIGDFGVLVYGGWEKKKALIYNFITALTAIVGALVGFALAAYIENWMPFLLAFAAGGFIYIASSDLIPELHKEVDQKKSMVSFLFFLIGLFLMWGLTFIG